MTEHRRRRSRALTQEQLAERFSTAGASFEDSLRRILTASTAPENERLSADHPEPQPPEPAKRESDGE